MRGSRPGVLLAAVGVDPNKCLFPIAFGVCEIESAETWRWFLEILIEDLRLYDEERLTIMSDRQKVKYLLILFLVIVFCWC